MPLELAAETAEPGEPKHETSRQSQITKHSQSHEGMNPEMGPGREGEVAVCESEEATARRPRANGRFFGRIPGQWALLALLLISSGGLRAEARQSAPVVVVNIPATATDSPAKNGPAANAPSQQKIAALFLSDIHFEPFRDPGKVQKLAASPVEEWDAILAASPSPDGEQRFSALQAGCQARGIDTSYALFVSSLRAMQGHAPNTKFVTVSGDLISHAFPCKYKALFPDAPPGGYRAFVIKTEQYVLGKLHNSFPGVPVYVALGNNDTDCGDYHLDDRSSFLAKVGETLIQGLPPSEQQSALASFAVGGYYSALLPAPVEKTRLIVLNDVFLSPKYLSCAGTPNPKPAEKELAWLRHALTRARQHHEKVWIMGHIPPGVDLISTVLGGVKICGGQPPTMFLSSGRLEAPLVKFDDIIQLGIFGHTHMDELRLLEPEAGGQSSPAASKGVAVKIVASLSPVNGNNPSFTVAHIDPVAATLDDYQVVAASDQTGINATWSNEYDFGQSFNQTVFSPFSLARIIAGFQSDPAAKAAQSQDYIRHFFVGDRSRQIKIFWPQYVCTFSDTSEQAFRSCVCSSAGRQTHP